MAKGWSFGALIKALKGAAFLDTGTAIGNVMTVGTFGIGRTINNPSAIDLSTALLVAGEVRYTTTATMTNAPAGLVFTGAIRILCIAANATSQMYLMSDDKGNEYILSRNDGTAQTWNVQSIATTDVSNGKMSILAANEISMGPSGSNFSTLLQVNGDSTNKGFMQTNHSNKSLALSGGGGRVTVDTNGSLIADGGIFADSAILSSMWGSKFGAIHCNAAPFNHIDGDTQGTFIGWNESGGRGESNFINNRGRGVGGFTFRIVKYDNSAETGKVTISGSGDIASTGSITSGSNVYVAWGGRGHVYQENGDIVETAGTSSIFRQMENATNLSGALGLCSRWTRTGARRDFGQVSRNNDKWLDDGWVVIGAGARGCETIQNLVLLGGRLQIYRANGGWVDSAT